MNIAFENKTASFASAERFAARAADMSADIIAFPEMTLTGFSMNTAVTAENGETRERFSALAKKLGIAIGFGWTENCGTYARNMYTVADKNGGIIAEYAKIHPFSFAGEDKFFKGGSKRCFFEYMGVKIGIAVCYDLRFPQIFDGDYDLMLLPANWPEKRAEHWKILLAARAVENQAYFAGINCTGDMGGLHYCGDTGFYAPDGTAVEIIHNREGLAVVDINAKEVKKQREAFPVMHDRRYELYEKIYAERKEQAPQNAGFKM